MVNVISILTALLTLMAGIGVFIVACPMMSSNLESAASRRLKRLFSHTGNNKLVGVGIGTIGTAAIQSSGAVTVMVIGFVNVGIMSLTQAGTEYISLAQNSERVADHLINVAKTIRDLQ